MIDDDDWTRIRGAREPAPGLSGALRLSVFFGIAVIALAVLATPLARRAVDADSARSFFGVDPIATGSVTGGQEYTIRRSVLQKDPNGFCVIRVDGTRQGDC